MSLPNLTIPIELPIDIPLLLHPAVVHFVVAIPIIVILLEFINLFFRKRALSVFSLFLILIAVVAIAGAYFTGVTDGKEAFSALSTAGQAELKEHKALGIYIVYGSLVLLVLKLLFMLFSGFIARLFFIFILIGFSAVILKQGYDGGELVYKYGANNKAIEDIKSDKDDLKDELDELKEKLDELKKSKTEDKSVETKTEEEVKAKEKKEEDSSTSTTEESNSKTETNTTETNTTN